MTETAHCGRLSPEQRGSHPSPKAWSFPKFGVVLVPGPERNTSRASSQSTEARIITVKPHP